MGPRLKTDSHPSYGSSLLLLLGVVASVLVAVIKDFESPSIQPALFGVALLGSLLLAIKNRSRDAKEVIVVNEKVSYQSNLSAVSEELYTELYKNSPVPYLIINESGIVTSGNLAAKRFFGVTKGQVEGMDVFSRLVHHKGEHLDFLIEKFRNGISASDETVKVRRDDGSEAWALLSLFRLQKGTTDQMGLLTLVDITKQKQIENAKTEFVSLASHQLRTPIAGITWSAELLQIDEEHTLSERQQKYVDRLLSATKRMAILVDDFLRVSRFELGTLQAEVTPVAVAEVIKDILLEESARITGKKLSIITYFDQSLPVVLTDQHLLRMIMTNLITNAIKYTPLLGNVTISFAKRNNQLLLSVVDDGMGIPVEDQSQIFEKLFRASNAARAVPDGNGLGLYIIKEAVKVLKGNVSFVSSEDMGTTFEVLLPLEIPSD
jgi:PAS domain S-box-containing protein